METSICEQIATHLQNMDYVEYHIVRKDGTKLPVVDYGILDDSDEKRLFYVFVSEAKKKTIISKE